MIIQRKLSILSDRISKASIKNRMVITLQAYLRVTTIKDPRITWRNHFRLSKIKMLPYILLQTLVPKHKKLN
jgi:DNA integrity scanning protein DisA with diadenylate cyclase activity